MADKHGRTLADITSAYIAETAREAGEPAWLVDWRVDAWEFFVQEVPPEWRRTDLVQLHPENLVPSQSAQSTAVQWEETLASKGIVFTTLASAVRSHEKLVREKIGTAVSPHTHKFSALRAALWQDGIFLYVPANVALDIPLRVCYTLAEGSTALFPYSLVIVEPGASVTFIEDFSSHTVSEPALAGPTTEMFLGADSEVRYTSLQQWSGQVYHIGSHVQVFGPNATSEWVSIALGGYRQHVEAEARLDGDGSHVTWHGLTFANEAQHLLTAPVLLHRGGHTESQLDFRTVVTDTAYSVFDGMIRILEGSRSTTTRLEEHAIHLSPEARSDSVPGLRIDTNDVASAGHACTSGQVDDEQLFYMQSRGIPRDEAMRMIVMGVFEPALNAIPLDDMRDALIATIEAKI